MKFQRHLLSSEQLEKGYSYPEFVALTEHLVSTRRTTGADQSEAYLAYTRMSQQRMQRWDKTARIASQMQELMQQVSRPQLLVVLTEAWCGDGAQSIPYLAKLADSSPAITLKIFLRDEHPELMDAYLTNGARAIPKLLALTGDLSEVLFTWGPKPQHLMRRHAEFKKDPQGLPYASLLEEMHLWYAKNRHQDLENELFPLISSTLTP